MTKSRKIYVILILCIIFFVTFYLALFAGYNDAGTGLFFKTFHLTDDADSIILEVLRFPRVVKAIVAGSCLALAGLIMQAVSKNSLAEPYLTGVSSGAGLGIVLSILYFNGAAYSVFGFAGALVSSLLVISFAGLSRFSIAKLILTGLSVNLFVGSLISLFILTNADKAQSMMFILSGGFSDVISNRNLIILFLAGVIICGLLIPKLNFLRLDSNIISSFKKEKDIYNILMILISAFLTSVSVFAAGILGFIGIIVPQISKMLVGNDYRYLFITNILLGSAFILFADYIARTVVYPLQIPLGLVIAFIGAPVFIFFLTKKGDIFNNDRS